jgi:hypothetical protein
MASAKNVGEGTICALRDFIDHFILHEQRISASIKIYCKEVRHGEQSDYSLCDRHLSFERRCSTGRLLSSSSEDLAVITE